MKNGEVKNMDFGAEHHSVVQIQGSRGSGAERSLHPKMMKNRWQNHPKIDEKSIKATQNGAETIQKSMKNDEMGWDPAGVMHLSLDLLQALFGDCKTYV